GLGLTLGHGMSRFDPRPGHPNAPAPHKRPLHNMCPSVLAHRDGRLIAVGGAGGQRIPNAVYQVLTQLTVRNATLAKAIETPRLFCTGRTDVVVERRWPEADTQYLRKLGFKVRPELGDDSHVSAVSFDPSTG